MFQLSLCKHVFTMFFNVCALRFQNLDIVRRIVQMVFVLMVNDFAGLQCAS